MSLPIIGILLDYGAKKCKDGGYANHIWYALRYHYSKAIANLKGIPILIPYEENLIEQYIKLCDGILLSGSSFDIPPSCYGEKIQVKNINPFPSKFRLNFEFKLISVALKVKMPILAVCAGLQSLNVVLGGSLYQDVKEQLKTKINHIKGHHGIKITKTSQLHSITRSSEYKVNSFHHQAIKILGKDLIKTAVSADDVIEGIEHTEMPFCIGVEWHPEFLECHEDVLLFKAFVRAAWTYKH